MHSNSTGSNYREFMRNIVVNFPNCLETGRYREFHILCFYIVVCLEFLSCVPFCILLSLVRCPIPRLILYCVYCNSNVSTYLNMHNNGIKNTIVYRIVLSPAFFKPYLHLNKLLISIPWFMRRIYHNKYNKLNSMNDDIIEWTQLERERNKL